LAARRASVKVYEFSIGFPFSPKIVTLFRHRETDFTLRLLPLGGFVSFSKDGQDTEIVDLFLTSRANRALIMSAGALFNIFFAFLVFIPVFWIGKQLPLIDAMELSAKTIGSVIAGTVLFLFDIFSGSGGTEGFVGPVGIALYAGKAAAAGFLNLLYFTGMLSLSLGIMNLIPFPALDGGQLFMLLVEAVRRRPLSLKTYQVINLAGMTVFLVLTVLVTYRDVARLFT
jgi:regulator of sigma E protease